MSGPERYREIWRRKPALRAVYGDIYRRIGAHQRPGRTLEIGGGSGNLKDFAPDVVSTDILPVPWLDTVCDAQRLPFANGAFANIVLVDVLHHLERPVRFFAEAERVLEPGGRLIFCEPAITPLGGLVYRFFHHEPVDMRVDPLADGPITPGRDPYDSNQAIPTLLTGRYRAALAEKVPNLALAVLERFSFVAYLLSGGFRSWSLLPRVAANPMLRIEWALRRLFGPLAALRLLAVYAKRPAPSFASEARA
jgi:SAM-dependent methyltransferase